MLNHSEKIVAINILIIMTSMLENLLKFICMCHRFLFKSLC